MVFVDILAFIAYPYSTVCTVVSKLRITGKKDLLVPTRFSVKHPLSRETISR